MPDEMTGVGTVGSRTWILSVSSVITAPTATVPVSVRRRGRRFCAGDEEPRQSTS